MANRPNVFAEGRQILPTEDLYVTKNRFNNNVPAYTNIYDVWINFDRADGLTDFVNQHGFYDKGGRGSSIGSALSLFCSEAVLPGSTIETSEIRGLRQGVAQNYTTALKWYKLAAKHGYTADLNRMSDLEDNRGNALKFWRFIIKHLKNIFPSIFPAI